MDKLLQLSNEMNIELTPEMLSAFDSYYHMLVEKNKVMNLTAITEKDEVILKHFVDSISVAAAVPEFSKKAKILDVGTGAGFPGIPLKITFPDTNVTLLDSLNKRVLFLQEVTDSLGLNKITAIHDRAEDAARKPELRGRFEIVVSRAVAALPVLAEYTLPFLKEGGYLICYKTPEAEKELEEAAHAISVLGGGKSSIYEYTLPGTDITRSFIVIKKIKATPKAYPRKAGTAKKNPL